MIKVGTCMSVADNCGAKDIICIRILGSKKSAGVGDVIVVSVRSASSSGKISVGTVQRAVVVRVKKKVLNEDGSYISFDDNAAVLINKQNEMIGTRIFGPVHYSLRNRGFVRILSLSPEVLQ